MRVVDCDGVFCAARIGRRTAIDGQSRARRAVEIWATLAACLVKCRSPMRMLALVNMIRVFGSRNKRLKVVHGKSWVRNNA